MGENTGSRCDGSKSAGSFIRRLGAQFDVRVNFYVPSMPYIVHSKRIDTFRVPTTDMLVRTLRMFEAPLPGTNLLARVLRSPISLRSVSVSHASVT